MNVNCGKKIEGLLQRVATRPGKDAEKELNKPLRYTGSCLLLPEPQLHGKNH
jgi:hypothetical protein